MSEKQGANEEPIRHVSFKNVLYNLSGENKLSIEPIPYWDKNPRENLIEMGIEKYIIETEGKLDIENINQKTLNNFEKFLSNYLKSLLRLT